MLCDGKTPVEIDIPDLPWGGLVLSSNLRFACNRAAGGDAFRIVELPNLKPAAAVRLTGEPAQGTWYLSPAGNALLAQATASDWLLVNLSDRKRTPLHNTGPVGPFSFSPDGKIVLLVEKANPRFDATETPILMSVAAPRVTVELQGSTRDGRQQARSGKVYTNAVRLLGFAFAEEPVLYGIAEVIQSGPAGERTATLRRWRVPAGPDSPIAYDDIAPGLEPDVARLFFEFESVRPSRFRADVLGLSQDAGVLVFSRPVRDLYGSYGPKDTAIYRVESKKIVASIAQDFVALSPDGSRVLLHDRQKGRFTLFSTNAQQELPRLKSLPWESYGATELQMNPEWTRAIMAKPAAVPSIHCWSIAKHSGEN